MTTPIPVNSVNDSEEKIEAITCDCDLLWSLAQQFSYLRLSDKVGDNEYDLIGLYEARAKRIAATYARFYLEIEEGGNPASLGRYYWMALGAFASKTVACLLDKFMVKMSYAFGYFTPWDQEDIANGLGKGNFWLFMDISAPHWFYNHYPENFVKGMQCAKKRDANKLEKPVMDVVNHLPWADVSLPRIKNLAITDELLKGFSYISKIEVTTDHDTKNLYQMQHLQIVAEHEQNMILQKLIYDDPEFNYWPKYQRESIFSWAFPDYEITFTHACKISDSKLKSEAPDDMVVESYDSRMAWIETVAGLFNKLMIDKEKYMLEELNIIASWVDTEDASSVY